MALARDIPFSEYATNDIIRLAAGNSATGKSTNTHFCGDARSTKCMLTAILRK